MNKDQMIVLNWLKLRYANIHYPLLWLVEEVGFGSNVVEDAYDRLTSIEEFQVLKVFAEWGLKEGTYEEKTIESKEENS